MTIDYYISTVGAQSMTAALVEAGVTDDEGNPQQGHAIDVIGSWSERTGGADEKPAYTAVPGWHINVRSDHELHWPEGVNLKDPATPWRVWGGDNA